jgi:peptidase M50-like protein
MQALRKFLAWTFAFTSFVCLRIAVSGISSLVHRHYDHYHLSSLRTLLLVLVGPVLFTVQAAVFGVAWWTIWRDKLSARGWGIAASLTVILFPLSFAFLIVYYSRSISASELLLQLRHTSVLLAIGVTGLVVFWRRYDPTTPASGHQRLRIPGDGTSDLLNKAVVFLIFAVSFGAYSWWIRWLRVQGDFAYRDIWYRLVVATCVAFAVATFHELGHTLTGLALGMKLRAFLVGPLQWRMRGGKWEFQFNPAGIVSVGGATGVVPRRADLPRWCFVCMATAGPLTTLVTGALALWVALATVGNLSIQAREPLALFGAWSLLLLPLNLLPFRTADSYSDGAQIYQLLSKGPWGDFHRVVAVVGSTLVSPLRPRDFDIRTIQRAAHGITQGRQGLILRLYAYIHFLDLGKLTEAGEVLHEAESIYQESASNIPPELHTDFVFGNAYARRDAVAAREWWMRLEAKKPTRFNSDYWRAYSSLLWIEGNLQEANEAGEKANALAQQLPMVGAYEFDRYCCSLIRKALNEAAPVTVTAL